MTNGYIELMMPEHPNARTNGTILEHRYVAGIKMGRPLTDAEVVHHLDENKTNNNPENLIVFRTNADHIRFHKTGRLQLMEDGTYVCPVKPDEIVKCKHCGKYFISSEHKTGKIFCSVKCLNEYQKEKSKYNDKVSKEELLELVHTKPFTEIAKMFGVSDNAIRKWCKRYDIPYKYWDIHQKEKEKEKRFLLKKCIIIMKINGNNIKFYDINDAISYIKNEFNKNNILDRSIQTKISQAIKNKEEYCGAFWEAISK